MAKKNGRHVALALALALVALSPTPGEAQTQPKLPQETVLNQTEKIIVADYDLDSTAGTYCVLDAPLAGTEAERIETSGSSTTVTAVSGAGSGAPFANVAAGTYLRITNGDGTRYDRSVLSKSSSTSIVISGAALTLTSAKFQAAPISCGTGGNSGAFDVYAYRAIRITYQISQQNTTGGIAFRLECRTSGGAAWRQLDPELTPPDVTATYGDAFTSTGGSYWAFEGPFAQCRVQMKIETADDGSDVTTAAEQVWIWMTGRP